MLPKTRAYDKSYDGQIKWMFFVIEDDDLFEKYHAIWDKVNADITKKMIANLSITKIFKN